jgi:hypothetical protein
MSVEVYLRLSELLREKNLCVAELERQIEQRFRLSVDPKTLYRLTYDEPIQRADLQIVGAADAEHGVGLGDLFHVEAFPVDTSDEAQIRDLDPMKSQRLANLFTRQACGSLLDAEQTELESLMAEYGRQLHERRLREIAQQRGISVGQARDEATTQFDDARAWWRDFEACPKHCRAVVRLARHRRTKTAE